jgi:membrane-associated phospholipid phosphatase
MSTRPGIAPSSNYPQQLLALVRVSAMRLVGPPSHRHRKRAEQNLLRQIFMLIVFGGGVIAGLMAAIDANEIGMMPARGEPSLWPIRILTDFGKDTFVLWSLVAALVAIWMLAPLLQLTSRLRLLSVGTRLQYLFLAVLVPVLSAEVMKWAVGRARPFVGGKAHAFNFAPFSGTEAYFSFPSGHAVTSFALAFAIGAIWARARLAMSIYAVGIAITRLVLLAHHPSDVVGGALVGVIGAMFVRFWFASRRLVFSIGQDGEIVPRVGQGLWPSKRVADRVAGS